MKKFLMMFVLVIVLFPLMLLFPDNVKADSSNVPYNSAQSGFDSGIVGSTYNNIEPGGVEYVNRGVSIGGDYTYFRGANAGSSNSIFYGPRYIELKANADFKINIFYKITFRMTGTNNWYIDTSRINYTVYCALDGYTGTGCTQGIAQMNGNTVTYIFRTTRPGSSFVLGFGDRNTTDKSKILNIFQNQTLGNNGLRIQDLVIEALDDNSAYLNAINESQKQTTDAIRQHEANEESRHQEQKGWFGNIVNAVLSIPQTIANFIIDGLKSLFVPSEDDLKEIIQDMREPLANLGFVGELLDYGTRLIEIPLSLSQNGSLPRFDLGNWCFNVPDNGNVCLAKNVVFDMNDFKNNQVISLLLTTLRLYTSYLVVLAFVRRWNFQNPLDLIKGVGKA